MLPGSQAARTNSTLRSPFQIGKGGKEVYKLFVVLAVQFQGDLLFVRTTNLLSALLKKTNVNKFISLKQT